MKIALLIDYDNLPPSLKGQGLLSIVSRSLLALPKMHGHERAICEVRFYGGWYESATLTTLAQNLAGELLREFPTLLRVPSASSGIISVSTTATLAQALLEDPSHHLFNTFRRKGSPQNIRIKEPTDIGCANTACPLGSIKKLFSTGRCQHSSCSISAPDLVSRAEQKLVDTMLTCDLIYLHQVGTDRIGLVSADDDFIPPIRSLVRRGATVIRVHPRPNAQRQPIRVGSTTLTEVEI